MTSGTIASVIPEKAGIQWPSPNGRSSVTARTAIPAQAEIRHGRLDAGNFKHLFCGSRLLEP